MRKSDLEGYVSERQANNPVHLSALCSFPVHANVYTHELGRIVSSTNHTLTTRIQNSQFFFTHHPEVTYMEEEKARTPAVRCRQRRMVELNIVVFGLEDCFLLWYGFR
jgi:hypothetical protein